MKLLRFFKNIGVTITPKLQSMGKDFFHLLIKWLVVVVSFYAMGSLGIWIGIPKLFPQKLFEGGTHSESLGFGALLFVAFLLLFGIVSSLIVLFINLKKIWKNS